MRAQKTHENVGANGSTRVVMLGTGTPRLDPNRSGPATHDLYLKGTARGEVAEGPFQRTLLRQRASDVMGH
jgi:hypothetical protein